MRNGMNYDDSVILQQGILDMLKDGVFCLNKYWEFIYINKEAKRLLNKNEENVIGESIWKVCKDAKSLFSNHADAIMHRVDIEFEEYYQPLHCWFKIRAYPFKDNLIVQFQDITSSKKLLEETLQYHNSLFDYHPDLVFLMNLNGELLAVNRKFEELTGYRPDEMTMKSFFGLFPDELAKQSVSKAAQGERLKVEVKINKKDHNQVDVYLSLNPVIANEEIIAIYGIAKDITEEKFSKIEIARLTDLNELILNSVAEGIYGIDLHGKVIFWNSSAERMTGFIKEEFSNYYLSNTIHPTSKRGKVDPLLDCSPDKQMHVAEDIFLRKDGSSFPVEYTITPICEQGKNVGTVITFRDITERKRTEDILNQSEKLSAVGQLAAGIAHEIRNPLTSLKGFLQLIQASDSHKEEYYQIMNSEFNRIEVILSELLMVAKPQASTFTVYSMGKIIHEVTTLLEAQAVMKNIQIVNKIEEGIFVYCNSSQLKQVFINLIKNSIEAMNHGGIIMTHATKQGNNARVVIQDQGKGIPKEKLSQLGTPFYSTKEKGTGLGLMVTYRIIENHHGKIQVDSEIDVGTCFTITLPIAPETLLPPASL